MESPPPRLQWLVTLVDECTEARCRAGVVGGTAALDKVGRQIQPAMAALWHVGIAELTDAVDPHSGQVLPVSRVLSRSPVKLSAVHKRALVTVTYALSGAVRPKGAIHNSDLPAGDRVVAPDVLADLQRRSATRCKWKEYRTLAGGLVVGPHSRRQVIEPAARARQHTAMTRFVQYARALQILPAPAPAARPPEPAATSDSRAPQRSTRQGMAPNGGCLGPRRVQTCPRGAPNSSCATCGQAT